MESESAVKEIIENAWDKLESLPSLNQEELRSAVEDTLDLLDEGKIRISEKEKGSDSWIVNDWMKKAILLYFRLNDSAVMDFGYSEAEAGKACWFDKVELKFCKWNKEKFKESKIRAVPGSFVRRSAYIGKDVVLMPSFVNMGAHIGERTMIDSWVTIGSCAQIGKNCHISGGVGIGGVLEPLQAKPVIIEDNCFVGARSEVAEGVIVREGSVLAMGVYIGASTKIVNRETGEVHMGEVPPYSVVVPGSMLSKNGANGISLYCAVIVKKVDNQTRSKTSINDILREIKD